MFTLNLQPKDNPWFQRDHYAKFSAIDNMDQRWNDPEFSRQNGHALFRFVKEETTRTGDSYNFNLVSALVTVAAITPLIDIETQVETASLLKHVLRDAPTTGFYGAQTIDFDAFYQQHNTEARRSNLVASAAARFQDECYIFSTETVERLESRFVKTPAYEIAKMFQDNLAKEKDLAQQLVVLTP